ncbi:glycosyltransferase family 2 protein [Candidatus Saccharibacteria bacterium]|nr:glycosyltransferase family 2 protein [Candidatus Saccharibacteria bacterium]MBI3337837.1 glycosyltransferase family 2 protein [Candidatus Saccharibacteria bacterium]
MKVAVIIPDFNEGERVLPVIEAACGAVGVGEVIVVDDGSTDGTADLLASQDGIKVLTHTTNRGKGEALDTGMQYARGVGCNSAVFLDADLLGIDPGHINQLLEPLEYGSWMSIGYLGLRKTVVKKVVLDRWGALSGQRAIRTEVWDFLSEKDKHGWNIEAALNARVRKHGLHRTIARVALEGVSHVGKREKSDSLHKALSEYAKTYSASYLTYARIEMGF